MHLFNKGAFVNHSFTFVETTGSTNDDLKADWKSLPPPLRVIVARHQSAGRGRNGGTWLDSSGKSLLFSFSWIFPDSIASSDHFPIPLTCAVALHGALSKFADGMNSIWIKWPNDIWARDSKLAGILVETTFFRGMIAVVVGIGVNLYKMKYETSSEGCDNAFRSTSLEDIGIHVSSDDLLIAVSEEWQRVWTCPDPVSLANEFYSRSSGFWGRKVEIEPTDGEKIIGITEGIDSTGAIRIKREDGVITKLVAPSRVKFIT